MNFTVWHLYHCPCATDYALNVFINMNITISGLIMSLSELSNEDFCYEMFPYENSLLIACKKDLIASFVLDPYACFHYCKRRHFSFISEYITIYPKGSKVIKCHTCFKKSLKKIVTSFPVFIKYKK